MSTNSPQLRRKRTLLAGVVAFALATPMIGLGLVAPAFADDTAPDPIITESTEEVVEEETPIAEETTVVTEEEVVSVARFTTETPKKVFVCKYVGTPGANERLQTGQNPISVSVNAIPDYQGVGSYFADQHGRSYVLAEDTGQPEPDVSTCPPPTGVVQQEVAVYIYPLLDSTKPPAWENSGQQVFCESKVGTDWFTSVNCVLPPEVCGPAWGAQQDKVQNWGYVGPFQWPTNIQYPVDNIGWPPIYDAKHQLLSTLITVPDCEEPVKYATPTQPTAKAGIAQCVNGESVGTNGTITLPEFEGGHWAEGSGTLTDVPPGDYSFTAVADDGYELTLHEVDGVMTNLWFVTVPESTPVDCEEPAITEPGSPTKVDVCGVENDSFTLPGAQPNELESVTAEGTYTADDLPTEDGTVAVTFVPADGFVVKDDPNAEYEVDENGNAVWILVFTDEACLVVKPAVQYVVICGVDNDTVTTPGTPVENTEGITETEEFYYVTDPDGTDTPGTITVLAIPKDGITVAEPGDGDTYVIDKDGNASWTFVDDDAACPPPPTTTGQLPLTGGDDPRWMLWLVLALIGLGVPAVLLARKATAISTV